MLECGFCGKILSRRTWHTSSIYKKVNWQCVSSTKKGKKIFVLIDKNYVSKQKTSHVETFNRSV